MEEINKAVEVMQSKTQSRLSLARFDHKKFMTFGDDPTEQEIGIIKKQVYAEVEKLNPRVKNITPAEHDQAYKLVKNYIDACRIAREYYEKISNPKPTRELSFPDFAKLVIEKAKAKCRDFRIYDDNRVVIEKLCRYFGNDKKSDLDPEKGILLFGRIGCGKTLLMEIMQRNPKCSFVVRGCPEISFEYAKHGIERIEFYSNPWKTYRNEYGQATTGVCFDDLGTENERRHFGDKSDVIADILLSRYRNKSLWAQTFITTNLNADQISEIYGARIASRLSEMLNLVSFPKSAIDWRTQK